MKYYEEIFSEVNSYLQDDKNSLIVFLGDKYSGKTELLSYLYNKDTNEFKFNIFINSPYDAKDISIIRICFLKILSRLCRHDFKHIFQVLSDLREKNLYNKINLNKRYNARQTIKAIIRNDEKENKSKKLKNISNNYIFVEEKILFQLIKLFEKCNLDDLNLILIEVFLLI